MVAARLAESGCAVLDLDRVAHEVMAPTGPAYTEVVAAFGMDALAPDGTIDRRLLGARVFRDSSERERLNAIVHPVVEAEEARRVAALAAAGAEVVVSEAALLVETGLHLRFDRLIVTHCSLEQQRQRLERRNGLSREAAQARLDSQMPAEVKLRFAHLLVDTSASVADTERRATGVADELQALARRPGSPPAPERLLAGLAAAMRAGTELAARFIADVIEAGGVDLRRTARVFGHAGEPWYEPQPGSGHAPIELALPVVVHLLSRRGDDEDLLVSALASVGRALCDDTRDWADGCVFGLAAARLLAGGVPLRGDSWSEWIRRAERWTGASPHAPRLAEWRSLSPGSSMPAGASDAAQILSRLAAGAHETERPTALRELCERFMALKR